MNVRATEQHREEPSLGEVAVLCDTAVKNFLIGKGGERKEDTKHDTDERCTGHAHRPTSYPGKGDRECEEEKVKQGVHKRQI